MDIQRDGQTKRPRDIRTPGLIDRGGGERDSETQGQRDTQTKKHGGRLAGMRAGRQTGRQAFRQEAWRQAGGRGQARL